MDASTALIPSKNSRAVRKILVFAGLLTVFAVPLAAQRTRISSEPRPVPARKIDVERPERRQVPPNASVFFCENNNVQCRTELSRFDLDVIRDLYVFAAWKQVSGEHTQRIRFVLPDGNTYQILETKFTTQANSQTQGVQATVPSRGEPTTVSMLPVAGTHISQRSLAGTWVVELYLDGNLITRTRLVFR